MSRLLACLLALTPFADAGAAAAEDGTPYTLMHSEERIVRSAAGEAYRIMIAWPDTAPPPAGWPVLYVLDGEDNFAIAALTARRLARAGARGGVGEGIVVGIAAGPLERRVRDYTPATPGWTIPAGQPASGLATGGAEAFLGMIGKQVQPLVRRRLRIDPSRETLLGHSFGGLLALHAALTRPAMFDAVVAVSPSLWFGDGLIAREAAAGAGAPRILIAEGDQTIIEGIHSNTSPAELAQQLDRGRAAGRPGFLLLRGQSHGTTMLAAMAPAIGFAFGRTAR